uniref:Putative secreted protein n=1 Tax=Anopheles darlingi TaxID=43151 RepID=A0A2M4DAT7_ANODA
MRALLGAHVLIAIFLGSESWSSSRLCVFCSALLPGTRLSHAALVSMVENSSQFRPPRSSLRRTILAATSATQCSALVQLRSLANCKTNSRSASLGAACCTRWHVYVLLHVFAAAAAPTAPQCTHRPGLHQDPFAMA